MATATKFNQPLPANADNFVSQAGDFLRGAGDRIIENMIYLGEFSHGARKARRFQALNALSDAELAERGLTREGLPYFVFGPFYS